MKFKAFLHCLILWLFVLSISAFAEDLTTLQRKAEAGDVDAQLTLGEIHYHRGTLYTNRRMQTQQFKEAIRLLLPLAESGDERAQQKIDGCYAGLRDIEQQRTQSRQESSNVDEILEKLGSYEPASSTSVISKEKPYTPSTSSPVNSQYADREKTTYPSSTSGFLDDQYGESSNVYVVIVAILSWIFGLTPPCVIRFVFSRKPLSVAAAIGLAVLFLFINTFLSTLLNQSCHVKPKPNYGIVLIAFASFGILRKK